MPPRSEDPHPVATRLDDVSTLVWAEAMVADHERVAAAVRAALPAIARLSDEVARRLGAGGRLILAGAGTSGRLAALEAAECPPTFGCDPGQVVALVAGGRDAIWQAVEGAEDDAEAGAAALDALRPRPDDLIAGISASGSTRWVRGVLERARTAGSATAVIVGNPDTPLADLADSAVVLDCGPEVVAGSTRLKAGSAQKLALNVLTTSAFRALGRVRGGRMIRLRATNAKLRERAIGIVADLAAVVRDEAERRLAAADGDVARALAESTRHSRAGVAEEAIEIAIRRLEPTDAPSVAALANQPGVVATTAPFGELGGVELFARWLAEPGVMLGGFTGHELLGVVLASRIQSPLRAHVLDIGFVAVADTASGRGAGGRLLRAVLDAAVDAGVRRVELRVWPDNVPAIRLYERFGFVVEGRLRCHAIVAGRPYDALVMGWLAGDIAE